MPASRRPRAACARYHPEAVAPDELLVSERTGRIGHAAQGLAYRPAEIGETFGPQWATYWFRLAATVPDDWAGRPVELVWDSGCEALLYRDGSPRRLRQGRRLRPHHRAARHTRRPRGARAGDGLQRPDGPARPVPQRRDRTGRTWRQATDDRSLRAAGRPRAPGPRRPRPARPRGVGDGVGLRGAAPARRGARARPLLGGPPARRARPLRPHLGRRRPRHLARGARDPRRPARPPQRRAACTRSPRSATRTSTPPGCGRSPRPAARSCARGRASSR